MLPDSPAERHRSVAATFAARVAGTQDWEAPAPFAPGSSLADALLIPTRIYVASCLAAIRTTGAVKALAHITGGGFPDNIPRALPKELGVRLDLTRVPVLPVFKWLARAGNVSEAEMLRTFNCGIGMIVVASAAEADAVVAALREAGEAPVRLGEVTAAGSEGQVAYHGKLSL